MAGDWRSSLRRSAREGHCGASASASAAAIRPPPAVVRPGTSGFPTARGAWPASRGKIFAGGAGGTARLAQSLSLLSPSGQPAPKNTLYWLSAGLGGTVSSWAEVTVRFLSAASRVLASRTIGPVGRTRRAEFAPRAGSGVLPDGTTSAQVTVELGMSLTNYNGPNAPLVGYNRAVAADLSLAVAGGSTFGIPLDDPEEENPLYTINARNIGDLVGTAHETWKAYLQSANGPCDDTVHIYYWNDDQPMM